MAETETPEIPPIEEPPAPAAAPLVEPKLGWKAFVAMQHMREPLMAGFARWLHEQGHDAHGFYDRKTWEGWLTAARGHVARP